MPGIDKYQRRTGSCQNFKKSEIFGIRSQLVKICQVPLPSIEPVNPLRWLEDIYLIFPSSTLNTLVKYTNGFIFFF